MIRNRIIALIALALSSTVWSQNDISEVLKQYNKEHIPYLSVEELKTITDRDYVLLDAREQEEYAVSHIPEAIPIGYSEFSISQLLQEVPDKQQMIIVYCSIGVRSEQIAEQIKSAGYTEVYNLFGGIFEWYNKGNSVFNLQEQKTDSIHTYSNKWSSYLKGGIKIYE